MSPFSSADYHSNRESLVRLVSRIIDNFGFARVFCPAIVVESKEAFTTSYDSVAEDLCALRSSSHFLLHYVNSVKSSAIFEAGIAYELGLPSVYVVKSRQELPYLLRELEEYESLHSEGRGLVKIVEVGVSTDRIEDFVRQDWYPAQL